MNKQLGRQAPPSPASPPRTFLQRKCACGSHTPGGGSCTRCARNGGATLGRPAGSSDRFLKKRSELKDHSPLPHGRTTPEPQERQSGWQASPAPANRIFLDAPVQSGDLGRGRSGFIRFGDGHSAAFGGKALHALRGLVSADGLPPRCEWDERPPTLAPAEAPAPAAGPEPAPAGPAPAAPTPAAPAPAAPPAPPPPCVMASKALFATPAATPDTRRKVGVNERVEFRVGEPADWTASSGTPASAPAASPFTWTAPEAAGSTTITATIPRNGSTCSLVMTTILPSALNMTRISVDAFAAGVSGAGMHLRAAFPPNDVSFRNSEWLEVAGPASGVTGYFLALQTAGTDLSHHPNPSFVPISAANTYTSDHAAGSGFPAPWSAGAFQWVIPNRIKQIGGAGTGVVFTNSTQAFTIAADGTVTITKGGASVSRAP